MKRIIALTLILTLTACLFAVPAKAVAAPNYSYYMYGDVDFESGLDIIDVTVLQRYLNDESSVDRIIDRGARRKITELRFDGAPDYNDILPVYIKRYQTVLKEAADYDHNGEVEIIDATLMQRKLAEMSIPESYGGMFSDQNTMRAFYADHESGSATVGTPITFTADVISDNAVTYQFYIADYQLLTNEEVQCGADNTLTFTFDNPGRYTIYVEAWNNADGYSNSYLEYVVTYP